MTTMASIDKSVPRRDSHLFELKSLRDNVSSTDCVNKTKDDIIANPNYIDSQKYKRRNMNNSAMATASGVQSKTRARSRANSKSPSRANSKSPSRATTTNLQRQQQRFNESGSTERIHNHNSNEPGLGYSSSTDRIRNKQRSSNINSSLETNASTTPFSQQEQRHYQKGMSLELTISKPASDDNDMDYGNASQSIRSRAGSGDAASRYSHRSHRSGNRTLTTEESVGSTATSKGSFTSKQKSTSQSFAPQNLLNTRCQQWLALSLTHLISIASLHQGTHSNSSSSSSSSQPSSFGGYYYTSSSTNSNHPRRSSVEVAVLTLLSLAFTLSFVIGVGYFHGPFREYITTKKDESAPYVRGRGGSATTSFQKLREFITVEQLLSLLLLVVLSISSGLILSPNDNNNGGGSYQNLAVAGSEIWNANLFYGTWVGLYGGAYLTAHSFFCPGDDVRDNHGKNGMKLWFLMLFSSISASVTMLSVYSSITCQGNVLAESSYCQSSLTSGMLTVCIAVLSLCCIVASFKSNLGANVRLVYVASSSILLLLNSIALGVVTSPSGAGAEVGSVFLVSWVTWIIGMVLWKDRIIESFLTPHEEERRTAYVGYTKKNTRKRQRRRRSKRLNDVSSRSEETYNCTDDEGITSDEAMEEGGIIDNSDDSSDDGASGGTMTHSEFNHCLESISKNTDDDNDRRRHPLDPDGLLNRFHGSKTASDHYSGSRRDKEDPEGVRKEELDHLQQENLNDRYAPPRDAIEYYETPSSRGGGLDESSSHSSEYYSGSDAVQVQAGSQEEVSTLGYTLDQTTLQGNSNQREDSGGIRGGSMFPNGRNNNNNNGGTTQHRNYVQEGPSATNGGRRPISRDPSVYNDDNKGPDRQYLPKKDKSPASPVANRKASQTSSNGVDMEWDFAMSPEPPTPTPAAKKARAKKKTTTTAQTPLKTPVVPKATADTRRIPLRRRPSRDSLMSNCSPIEEGSLETSPGSLTGVKNKTGTGVSGPMTTSKSTKGGESAKNDKRSNTKNARRGKTPPPPPRSEKQKQNRAAGLVQRHDGGISSSIPGAAKKEARKQASSSSSESSQSISTSSSDFDIVVSGDHSVITELTAEGFDVPGDDTSSSAGASDKVDTEAAANYSTYMPKRNDAQKPSTSHFPSSTNSPPSLPQRLPLYNGSDDSPPNNDSISPGDSESTPAGLRGQDVHPSVEAFLVSAMKNARLSQGYSNMDEMPATTDEEGSTGDRRHQQMRRKSGGVNSAGSSKGRKRRGNDSGSGSEGREKRTQEGSSRRKRSQSTPKKSRSKESARKKGESDTDNARPKLKVLSVPTKDGK